jgi:NADPH:quinone reductase-like Zn-dependent oxidoreductase
MAIQWAKQSGLEVITTCSPRNFDYVKSLGADEVFDYSAAGVGQKIREYTANKLFYAYDTISEKGSDQVCADALSSEQQLDGSKPQYCSILGVKFPRSDVDAHVTLGYTIFGEAFEKFGNKFPAKPQDFEFQKTFLPVAEKLLEQKKIKPHRYEVRPGGLDGILDGLKDLEDGKISGVKVVYRIDDAP